MITMFSTDSQQLVILFWLFMLTILLLQELIVQEFIYLREFLHVNFHTKDLGQLKYFLLSK